ncbi:MAG: BMP family ABC transporter substrate-binding protein [Clostridia bacterium]|nr:BMP family ABC transporter substrate-binding protein [Clostridia bacterium]
MKKIIALALSLLMVFAIVACTAAPANSGSDKYEIAMVTDVGALMDKSFNQGTWEGCEAYAKEHGLTYKYYQPANGSEATDDDRYDAMKAAVQGGAKVIVTPGFLQGNALEKAAKEFPEVKFIFIDGWSMGLDNVSGIAYKEEQSGYLAGYAAVMEGYTKLGFCGGGGGTNPACCRYGYGFVQGAEAAAEAKGVDVEIKYTWQYGASFSASPELQTMVGGWYEKGTEIVFSAGGSIFNSITAAAAANDAKVIGVDVDQSYESDTVVTSALKGLTASVKWALAKVYDGTWAEISGANSASLGAESDAVGLPTATWSLKNWTVAEYEALLASIKSGAVVVDNTLLEADAIAAQPFKHVTIQYV